MEEESLKTFSSSNVALVAKGNRPKGNKNNQVGNIKKCLALFKKARPKIGIAKK